MSFDQLISASCLGDGSKPKYQAIAEEFAHAIRTGQLAPGEKLPPQRNLAVHLGVTTGTVSRAYAYLERLRLATARVGDGTYVRTQDQASETPNAEPPSSALIDLAHNVAIPADESLALMRTLADLSTDLEVAREVMRYQPEAGWQRHREAGAAWLRRFGTSGNWSRVMITNGAQHALACVLRTFAHPGDALLTESLSYPGLRALALSMRLQLIGVEIDDEGILPSALERAAKNFGAKLMFCTPTLHNPTTSTMSMQRRDEVAAVVRRCGLLVIEDCVHAAMLTSPLPALSTLLPDHSFLLSSFSKVTAPGMRVGFLETSPEWLSKIAAIMRADCWMVAPLMPEIATRWMEGGALEHLFEQQRQLVGERLACASEVLNGLNFMTAAECPIIWFPLPNPWRAGQFSAALRQAGVLIRTADHFAVGRSPAPHAVRISLNAVDSIERLEHGLKVLKSLINNPPSAPMDP